MNDKNRMTEYEKQFRGRFDRCVKLLTGPRGKEIAAAIGNLQGLLKGTDVSLSDLSGFIDAAKQPIEATPPQEPVSREEAFARIEAFLAPSCDIIERPKRERP